MSESLSEKKQGKAKNKTAAKKPVKQDVVETVKNESVPVTETKATVSVNPVRKNNTPILLAAGLIGLVAALGYFLYRTELVVATVNGKPISRIALIRELEKENGTKTLDTMITKQLILDEAQKQNIKYTDTDVAPDLKQIEDSVTAQGQKLDDLLTAQGMTRATLLEQIKLNKMVEAMATKNVAVSEEDIDTFVKENEKAFPANMDKATIREQAKQQLEQQKKSEAIQSWITDLRSKAKIVYQKTLS